MVTQSHLFRSRQSPYHALLAVLGMPVTKHADRRAQQRGFRAEDLALIMQFGEDVAGRRVLTDRVVDQLMLDIRRLGSRLDRLRGACTVPGAGEAVVTVYRPRSARGARRLSRLLED